MFLKPDGRIDLEHRAYYLGGAPNQSVVVAAAEDGHVSIVTSNVVTHTLRFPSKIAAISPHPNEPILAWTDRKSGSLNVETLEGSQIHAISSSQTFGDSECCFDDTGDFLWHAFALNAEECEVRLIETATWSLIEKTTIADPVRWKLLLAARHGKARPHFSLDSRRAGWSASLLVETQAQELHLHE